MGQLIEPFSQQGVLMDYKSKGGPLRRGQSFYSLYFILFFLLFLAQAGVYLATDVGYGRALYSYE